MQNHETLYANRWFRVVRDGAFHFVEESAPSNSAAVLVRLTGPGADMGRFVLENHLRPAAGKTCLEIPRGGGRPGESAAQCAAREVREETGYILKPGQLIRLGAVRANTAILAGPVHLFYGTASLRVTDTDGEVDRLVLLTADELIEHIGTGVIDDGFTLAACMQAVINGLLYLPLPRPRDPSAPTKNGLRGIKNPRARTGL